ncbi:MAG: hypothetical protein ACTHJY_07725 [Rhizobiaceae bacterium]
MMKKVLNKPVAYVDEIAGGSLPGRARMFGDKSIGLYDPGQLALVRIIEGLGE